MPTAAPQPDLSKIADAPIGGENPDSETQQEQRDLISQEREALLRGLIQNIDERKKYAGRIFCLLSLWLAGMFFLLLLQGSENQHFKLTDGVLMAAIGGTTINVIGIFIVVTRYLFPSNAPKDAA